MAERVINGAHRNDLVLATGELSISVSVLTTRIHSVDPREYFMDYLSDDPGFHYFKRKQLTNFVENAGPFHRAATRRNLRLLGVDVVLPGPIETEPDPVGHSSGIPGRVLIEHLPLPHPLAALRHASGGSGPSGSMTQERGRS